MDQPGEDALFPFASSPPSLVIKIASCPNISWRQTNKQKNRFRWTIGEGAVVVVVVSLLFVKTQTMVGGNFQWIHVIIDSNEEEAEEELIFTIGNFLLLSKTVKIQTQNPKAWNKHAYTRQTEEIFRVDNNNIEERP